MHRTVNGAVPLVDIAAVNVGRSLNFCCPSTPFVDMAKTMEAGLDPFLNSFS